MPDVFKILKDLELKAVGLDEKTNKMQEGYFVSFRSVGLPIRKQDFANPWNPFGASMEDKMKKDVPIPEAKDPKDAPKTDSEKMEEKMIADAAKVQKISNQMMSYLNTFLLVDDQLSMNNQYAVMPNSSKVSDAWWAIITGANGIPTHLELNADMKKAYEDAKAKMMDKDGNPTPHYEAYMRFQDEYRSKVRSWNKAYAAAFTNPMRLQQWPIEGKLYHEDADDAMDRWVAFGFKQEIENAMAILAAQGTDPAIALIARAKKRYQNSLLEFQSVGEIPYIIMQPNTWYDKDDDEGWNQYTSQDFHTESHYQASSTAYGGGGGFNVGFWRAGGSFNHSESQQKLDIKTDNLTVSFSYCSVDIRRPWLDTSLLKLANWFLVGDYKKGCISNGKMGQVLPENQPAFLPAVVTSLILVKDLLISWSTFESDWEETKKSTSASASVGWGPFAVHGSYSHHDEKRDFTADVESEGLSSKGIQLVGYVSTITPFSPSHDSSEFLQKEPNK